MNEPKWTLTYPIDCGEFIGTGWEFFGDRQLAVARQRALHLNSSLRPFEPDDAKHLVTRMCLELKEAVEKGHIATAMGYKLSKFTHDVQRIHLSKAIATTAFLRELGVWK